MDKIKIEDLKVFAHHGVFPEETKNGQTFWVSAVLYMDTRPAGLADKLNLSTNYGEVCYFITKWMQQHTYQLIEAAAENVARELLYAYPLIQAVDLEIKKPEAPIGLPFHCVSVQIYREWHKVYLSIGSNIGDKEQYIRQGIEALEKHKDIQVEKVSQLIITKPYGGVQQEDFLNGAVCLRTLLSPIELLQLLHKIEAQADRKRDIRWGPRTLDLDILFYDKLIYEEEQLIVPHVDIQNRDFVLKPMVEIAPNFRHPIFQKTMQELLTQLINSNKLN